MARKPAKKKAAKKKPDPAELATADLMPGDEGVRAPHGLGLTNREELFAQTFVATGVATEAYRAAYSTEKMKGSTVNRKAFDIVRRPRVADRIRQLRTEMAAAAGIDQLALVFNLVQERDLAMTLAEPQHATRATMALADLLGFTKQRMELEVAQVPALTPKEARAFREEAEGAL